MKLSVPTRRDRPLLIALGGPTASGKSDLSLKLAQELTARGLRTEILNADSVQTYQGLDIGSAKPSLADRQRVVHHLIDIVPLGASLTAAEFTELTRSIVAQQWKRGVDAFVLVGGSGFYIKALAGGLWRDAEPDAEFRAEAEQFSGEELWSRLQLRDPVAAERIGPQDRYRIVRALEVLARKPEIGSLSDLKNDVLPDWDWLFAALEVQREALEPRVKARLERMLALGFQAEVELILTQVSEGWRPLQSIGYREMVDLVRGRSTSKEFFDRTVTRTLQLAKRQRTWLRGHPEWQVFRDADQAQGYILERALTDGRQD